MRSIVLRPGTGPLLKVFIMVAAYLWRLRPAHRSPHHRRRNIRYPKSELVRQRTTPPPARQ